MNNHFNLTDTVFEKEFATCKLDPSLFIHEAHLRLAWIHIDKYGAEKAEKNIEQQLQNFVRHVGATTKYHKTLTIVAIRAVNHFMNKSRTTTFKDFIVENPHLKTNFKGLIESHYSCDIIKSEKAKIEFLDPDLIPFN